MPDTRWLHMGRRSYRQYLVCRDYVYLICLRYEVMFILPRMCGPLSDRESTCHADQFQDLSLCDVLGPVPWHPSGKFT